MPSTKGPRPDDIEGIWREHESVFRRLYQKERKTLKEVKHFMETEHKFPITPLSTYESKLRDMLQLRKKLKKTDWPIVYSHWRERNGRETGIYLNGSRIPCDKVWKEIRRSGAHISDKHHDAPLPPGLVLRTPSPKAIDMSSGRITPINAMSPRPQTPRPLNSARPIPLSFQTQVSMNTDRTDSGLDKGMFPLGNSLRPPSPIARVGAPRATGDSNLLDFDHTEPSLGWLNFCLENIPFNVWKSKLHLTISDNVGVQNGPVIGAEYQNLYDTGMNISGQISASDSSNTRSRANLPNLLGLEAHNDRRPFFEVPAPHFDTYHFLAKAVFLLSNKLIMVELPSKDEQELFEILFSRISTRTLLTLLNDDHPSIRAAWETLVELSNRLKRKDVFLQLIDVGLKHVDWVNTKKQVFLDIAASCGSLEVVQKLLSIGARPDRPVRDHPLRQERDSIILKAVNADSLSCARVLIQNCDVNRIVDERDGRSNFTKFLSSYKETEIQEEVLKIFLDAGADVDSIQDIDRSSLLSRFHRKNKVPEKWRLTILEQCLYERPHLFKTLVHYSRQASKETTRAGVCLAAEQGRRRLGQYLDERPGQNSRERKSFLELILAEQFTALGIHINTQLVLSLIDFGVNIQLPFLRMMGMRTNTSDLMYLLVVNAARRGCDPHTATLLTLLLKRGTILDDTIIEGAVAKEGLGMLPLLSQLNADIKNLGGRALVTASRSNNREAVSWLLGAGVDVNAGVPFGGERRTVFSLVNDMKFCPNGCAALRTNGASCEMIQYLLCCGAKLRCNPDETHPFTFLRKSIQASHEDVDLLAKTRLYLDCGINLRDPAGSNELLLEACLKNDRFSETHQQQLATFELLFRRGAPVRPGSALVFFIYKGGRNGLIEEVLNAGADIHSYAGPYFVRLTPLQAAAGRCDQELVSMLLSRGADINQPAADYRGRTALQAVCEWRALSAEDNFRRRNLISYLIEQGADVKASPSEEGLTALQATAMHGDIELASLLLDRGADPNELSPGPGGRAALDGAAMMGRLDMVQFLLTVGALSHHRGRSGYAGAIVSAENKRHTTVADLLRRHAAHVNGIFETAFMSSGREGYGEIWSYDNYDSGGESWSNGNDWSEE